MTLVSPEAAFVLRLRMLRRYHRALPVCNPMLPGFHASRELLVPLGCARLMRRLTSCRWRCCSRRTRTCSRSSRTFCPTTRPLSGRRRGCAPCLTWSSMQQSVSFCEPEWHTKIASQAGQQLLRRHETNIARSDILCLMHSYSNRRQEICGYNMHNEIQPDVSRRRRSAAPAGDAWAGGRSRSRACCATSTSASRHGAATTMTVRLFLQMKPTCSSLYTRCILLIVLVGPCCFEPTHNS